MHTAVMFSGGADSCLTLRTAINEVGLYDVVAVYVNFIGQSDPREKEFVVKKLSDMDVACIIHDVVVHDHGKGPEGNARREFKSVLDHYLRSDAFDSVWIGHNKDDHIETVLIQAFRGAGSGSKGIPDQRQGKLYRPILNLTRDEVRARCVENGDVWYSDPMNSDENLTRVFFREQVIPLLKSHYGDGVYNKIDKIARRISQGVAYEKTAVGSHSGKCKCSSGTGCGKTSCCKSANNG